MERKLARWTGWIPAPFAVSRREIAFSALGMGLSLLVAEWLSRHVLQGINPWFIAPMGASAVLLFGVQASPLAQPWPVLGGNVVSAMVGVACQHWLGHGGEVAALAGALAIVSMFALRCLHPPGGAVALTAVLGGAGVYQMGYGFVLWPVAANTVLMLGLALLFNNAVGRRYPHQGGVRPHKTTDPLPSHRGVLGKADLDAALASYGELLDVNRNDLEEILVRAQTHAMRRHWKGLRCEDIMSRDVVRVRHTDSVDAAWELLARHKVKALPVVDSDNVLVGIVSLHDFFLGQTSPDPRRVPLLSHARRVEGIMTRKVIAARPEQAIADLVTGFSDRGLHHMPVVDARDQVVGMITQSDVVAALFHALAQR